MQRSTIQQTPITVRLKRTKSPGGKLHLTRGSVLIEMAIAMLLLGAFSFITLKGSIDIIVPRQWVIYQTMTDAYLSYEQAYAERASFDILNGSGTNVSPWPISPLTAITVTPLGVMPNGRVVTGTVTRTRVADPLNIPTAGTAAQIAAAKLLNHAEMETWQLQSILTYQIGSKTYYKSRTVVRSQ